MKKKIMITYNFKNNSFSNITYTATKNNFLFFTDVIVKTAKNARIPNAYFQFKIAYIFYSQI